MDEYSKECVGQAKKLKRLLNNMQKLAREARLDPAITEDAVSWRLEALESSLIIFGNDATALVMDWESEGRFQEERHGSTTG